MAKYIKIVMFTMMAVCWLQEHSYASDTEVKTQETSNNERVASLPWQGTIMFDRESLSKLYDISNRPGVSVSTDIKNFTGNNIVQKKTDKEKEALIAPVFSLNTVIYYSPESWSLWLNNKKIRKGQKSLGIDGLQITGVRHDEAEFLWYAGKDLDKMSPEWNTRLNYVPQDNKIKAELSLNEPRDSYNWDYVSENGHIEVDSKAYVVKFRLGINQSFASRNMSIVEGSEPSYSYGVAEGESTGDTSLSGSDSSSDSENKKPLGKSYGNLEDEINSILGSE